MKAPRLFLGIPLEKKESPPPSLFLLKGGELYLEILQFKGTFYLGKYVPPLLSLEELEQLRANIITLAKPLINNQEPLLLPLTENIDAPFQNSHLSLPANDSFSS